MIIVKLSKKGISLLWEQKNGHGSEIKIVRIKKSLILWNAKETEHRICIGYKKSDREGEARRVFDA